MEKFLSLPKNTRRLAIEQTAIAKGLPFVAIEKDFWVCWTLEQLFNLCEIKEHITFKGGTSLSKVWGLVDRFSEDIDLVIDKKWLGFTGSKNPEDAPSRSKQDALIKSLKGASAELITCRILPELKRAFRSKLPNRPTWSLEMDPTDKERQTILFSYPRLESTAVGYMPPWVKIELGACSDVGPFREGQVCPELAFEFPQLFDRPRVELRALDPKRTFLEKVTLLQEETKRRNSSQRKKKMARHYYDVARLIQSGIGALAGEDPELFERVVAHRRIYFRKTWIDYDTLTRATVNILPEVDKGASWRKDYAAMQKEMFYGSPPTWEDVMEAIQGWQAVFNRIKGRVPNLPATAHIHAPEIKMSEPFAFDWNSILVEDIRGFADTDTNVELQRDGNRIWVSWLERGNSRREAFEVNQAGDFRWKSGDGSVPLSYLDFLSSEGMGDFATLASAIARRFPLEPFYISTMADVHGEQPTKADNVLADKVEEALSSFSGQTQLIFVKGDAGAGKTTLLQQIVARQAKRYLGGKSKFLYLIINAKGRSLSNLSDAMAHELGVLRSKFFEDAIPGLVRRGLIVPIIDGFDELLGAAGYKDAFGSLRGLLEKLAGTGVMIVSARSSFYDVEFVSNNTQDAENVGLSLLPVTLHRWELEEICNYLAMVRGLNQISDEDRRAIAELSEYDRNLLGKPFFASKFPEYQNAKRSGFDKGELLPFLIDSYVNRESSKIVDRDGLPLLDSGGYSRFFQEVSDFMWTKESRRLSTADLGVIAELMADEHHLTADAAKQFITKITSIAGFKTIGTGQNREFAYEHEIYFDYFLAVAIRRAVASNSISGTFLNRGLLPEPVVENLISNRADGELCLSFFREMAIEGQLYENLRRNLGQIISASFRMLTTLTATNICNVTFVNVSFGHCLLNNIAFSSCTFIGTGFELTRFENCHFRNCMMDRVRVSDASRLNISGLIPSENITSLAFIKSNDIENIYGSGAIAAKIRELGGQLPESTTTPIRYSRNALEGIKILKRLEAEFLRKTVICTEEDRLLSVFRDPVWKILWPLLKRNDILEEESRQTRGNKKMFVRQKIQMPKVMRYQDGDSLPNDNLGNFWREMQKI